MKTTSKGFTLIELLVVIAIVAVLAVTVILTLNPAQLLKQARDSNRTQDLSTLKSALSLYMADVNPLSIGTATNCYTTIGAGLATCTTAAPSARFASNGTGVVSTTVANQASSTGAGWIPVNFGAISAGSPISALPIDPINNGTYFYAYRPDTTNFTFELNAKMESTKFSQSGSGDVESTDGGNNNALLEVGTAPGLSL